MFVLWLDLLILEWLIVIVCTVKNCVLCWHTFGVSVQVQCCRAREQNFLIFIFKQNCPPRLVKYCYFSNKNTFPAKKKFFMIFPYIIIEKPYKCSSIFLQKLAIFDFNCKYLENANTLKLLIRYHSTSLQPLHVSWVWTLNRK